MAPPTSVSLPARQHSEESWIEIGSRPSSSSLSSVADEIITTGLRVQHDSNTHRRRRRRAVSTGPFQVGTGHRVRGGNSSQEEYDESESESDRVMTSSTEGIGPSPLQQELRRASRNPHSIASSETTSEREGDDEDEDDDENATAVNYPRSTGRQFEPRPNAFSHPPTHAVRAESGARPRPRRPAVRSANQRHSFPQHSPYNTVSPNFQPDHDEALRASLSTLLSAAAAVRGLPKPGQTRTSQASTSSRVDPTSLRLVPESVALGDITEDSSNPVSSNPSPSISSPTSSDKSKRKASPPTNVRSSSKDRRAVKKARRVGPLVDEISPTLLTWVVSAGVVVLVSALSFSAGYVVGKETGHAEAMGKLGSAGSEAGRCGKEAGMGLRRLRWSGAGAVVRV
ncbi:hypothetical protein K504DRAFT_471718 [Pleomassaria siparia CBS 279.74]|uniref:REJ domain-containing protein n=1 Tax=Pleomassaria siparia CBS 279.74 TaxID=1314801 RepID=A0A6G1JX93_9PLEO|nr:hypothetical protein K504DRAFT_471718 [Pleomassaria siparia CBS 279.74]